MAFCRACEGSTILAKRFLHRSAPRGGFVPGMYGLRELVGKYTGSDNGRIEILLYWLRLGAELLHWRQVLKPLDERGRKASG
jgi:hypothetical protein